MLELLMIVLGGYLLMSWLFAGYVAASLWRIGRDATPHEPLTFADWPRG